MFSAQIRVELMFTVNICLAVLPGQCERINLMMEVWHTWNRVPFGSCTDVIRNWAATLTTIGSDSTLMLTDLDMLDDVPALVTARTVQSVDPSHYLPVVQMIVQNSDINKAMNVYDSSPSNLGVTVRCFPRLSRYQIQGMLRSCSRPHDHRLRFSARISQNPTPTPEPSSYRIRRATPSLAASLKECLSVREKLVTTSQTTVCKVWLRMCQSGPISQWRWTSDRLYQERPCR